MSDIGGLLFISATAGPSNASLLNGLRLRSAPNPLADSQMRRAEKFKTSATAVASFRGLQNARPAARRNEGG